MHRSSCSAQVGFIGRWAVALIVTALAASCSGRGDGSPMTSPSASSKYTGSYSGIIRATSTTDGTTAPGVLLFRVDASGAASANVYDINTGGTFSMTGVVDAGGNVSLSTADQNGRLLGQFSMAHVRGGLWSNAATRTSGTWYAEHESVTDRRISFAATTAPTRRLADPAALTTAGIALDARFVSQQIRVTSQVVAAALGLPQLQTRDLPVTAILYSASVGSPEVFLYFVPNSDQSVTVGLIRVPGTMYLAPQAAGGLGAKFIEIFPTGVCYRDQHSVVCSQAWCHSETAFPRLARRPVRCPKRIAYRKLRL